MTNGRPFDADAIDEVERCSRTWRSTYARQLSERYVPGEGCEEGEPSCVAFIIGEAPGAHEDLKRRPFVGDSGLVLRELMASAGLFTGFTPHFGKSNCWLTNTIKFRPPGNRTPDSDMIKTARHLLRTEWAAVGMPQVIIPVGSVALEAVLGHKASILRMAGELTHVASERYSPQIHSLWPMVHPAFVLRETNVKTRKRMQALVEKDWTILGGWLKEMGYTR